MKKRRVSLGAALYKAGNEESIEVMVSQDVEKLRGIIVISYHPIRTYFEVTEYMSEYDGGQAKSIWLNH